MPKQIPHYEFSRLDSKVFDSTIEKPAPSGNLAISVELEDGVPFFLQAGDVITGLHSNESFKGYFDGVVKYDPDKGWGIQVRTGPMDAINVFLGELKTFKIYD